MKYLMVFAVVFVAVLALSGCGADTSQPERRIWVENVEVEQQGRSVPCIFWSQADEKGGDVEGVGLSCDWTVK